MTERAREKALRFLREAEHVVFLTGAGVSASSGIPTFQQTDREWPYPEERSEVMSLPFFLQEPERFWEIYPEIFGELGKQEPTRFHRAVAALEKSKQVTVITQNVDGLHTLAGSTDVLEVHGNHHFVVCLKCEHREPIAPHLKLGVMPLCPTCQVPLKPDVCLFLEGVNSMGRARELTQEADLFVVAGTSLRVGPVNELPSFAEVFGTCTFWVNPCEPPTGDFHYYFNGKFVGDSDRFAEQVLEKLL